MGVSMTSDLIKIMIKMQNPSHETPASSESPNEDLKDMHILCTLKIKMESHGYIMGISKTSDSIQIKIKMPNLSQAPPTSFKAKNQD